ncbi:MAG: response regulator [Planctomycetes bacterium]|nr:response regulator [Planctomycetota bacterium]
MVSHSNKGRRILVVEDEPDVAGLLKARLESSGYVVEIEHEGRKAVEHAEVLRPDLVILDLMLPDIDGYAVSEHLRRVYHSCMVPILMLTAKSRATDKLYGFGAGADAYMTKPYDAAELLGTVEKLLRDAGLD